MSLDAPALTSHQPTSIKEMSGVLLNPLREEQAIDHRSTTDATCKLPSFASLVSQLDYASPAARATSPQPCPIEDLAPEIVSDDLAPTFDVADPTVPIANFRYVRVVPPRCMEQGLKVPRKDSPSLSLFGVILHPKRSIPGTVRGLTFTCRECQSQVRPPERRRGPDGMRSLCNKCGLRFRKKKADQRKRAFLGD